MIELILYVAGLVMLLEIVVVLLFFGGRAR